MAHPTTASDDCHTFRPDLPLNTAWCYPELMASADLTAVVWRVACGLEPGEKLPPVIRPLKLSDDAKRPRNPSVHDYAYAVLVSTYFDPSLQAARQGVAIVVGERPSALNEVCQFMRRFWQEKPMALREWKTSAVGSGRRFRLQRLWRTWSPEETRGFLDFVRRMAQRYAERDPGLGWSGEPFAGQG